MSEPHSRWPTKSELRDKVLEDVKRRLISKGVSPLPVFGPESGYWQLATELASHLVDEIGSVQTLIDQSALSAPTLDEILDQAGRWQSK